MSKIPFFKTYINKSANNKVISTLNSNFINEGFVVNEFELKLRKFLDLKYINTTNVLFIKMLYQNYYLQLA